MTGRPSPMSRAPRDGTSILVQIRVTRRRSPNVVFIIMQWVGGRNWRGGGKTVQDADIVGWWPLPTAVDQDVVV